MKIKTSRRNSIYTVNSFSLHLQKICDKKFVTKTSATIRLKDSDVQRSEKKQRTRIKASGFTELPLKVQKQTGKIAL